MAHGVDAWTSLASQPLHKKEGSGTAPLLELFCWNAINITRATYFYASLAHCGAGDKLTAHRACVQQARCAVARVVHAYIPRSCRSHKICIFMFPRISGEKNNSSNGAVPDPSFFVKGLARETMHGPDPAIRSIRGSTLDVRRLCMRHDDDSYGHVRYIYNIWDPGGWAELDPALYSQ